MSDAPTRLLGERIGAIIERVKILADERDASQRDGEAVRSRAETNEREHARLRTVISEAVRELGQE